MIAQRHEVIAWLGPARAELEDMGTLEDFLKDALADPEGDWIEILEGWTLPNME